MQRRRSWWGPARRLVAALVVVWTAVHLAGCAASATPIKTPFVERLRAAAEGSRDPERVGAWLLGELLAPGGKVERARAARQRLDRLDGHGWWAELGRAVDDDVHGRFGSAAERYLALVDAARQRPQPDAALVGWVAANRLGALRSAVAGLWPKARASVEAAIASPGHLGWRSRGELVEWWGREQLRATRALDARQLHDEVARRHGCLRHAMLAGPFGHAPRVQHRVHFEAERPAPWPARFGADPQRQRRPRRYAVERHGCLLRSAEGAPSGIYYAQSFIDLAAARSVLIAVQGAYALFVDDREVLSRDTAQWGIWPRFGAAVRLEAGRHRILARLGGPETSIRVLHPDGRPLGLDGSVDEERPYALTAPVRLPDPNVLEPFLRAEGVPPQAGATDPGPRLDTDHPVLRYLASYLAHVDGQDDVASVLLEPLVEDGAKAAPLALAQQAVYVAGDPIYTRARARDLARDLRKRARKGDPGLWGPRLWLALERADKSEPAEVVSELEQLAAQFPEVPVVIRRLANIYAGLGWQVEHARSIELAAQRFPESVQVLEALLHIHERRGDIAAADRVAARILEIDPTAEVEFRRAMERRDYTAAIAELERIGSLRQDRQDIAIRIADLLARAGRSEETLTKLELALRQDPSDAAARLALADAHLARGDRGALTDALVDAIGVGAESRALRSANELVEGMTDLEPYRRDGLEVIRQAEASGLEMPGTAARILDYAALWIAADGSARMLEHEIIRIQAREGIAQHAEQRLPRGLVLRLRTIKSDGQLLEPELVPGKPTVTMPHLEVGDYVETESIWVLPGDREGGRAFLSPRWFFREENVSYHLSELVVVSPRSRPLVIETTGEVPEPELEQGQALEVRRWRVDRSPALPEEPLSAPIQEFLPSVQVGWGISLADRLHRLVDLAQDETPLDPRLRRLGRAIAAGERGSDAASASAEARARRLYRWVLDTVQPGTERSGPAIIMAKSGDRTQAFLHLCRLAGIDARLGLIQDRLSPRPHGPFSEAARHSASAVRLVTERGPRWMVLADRFAPFGYLPSSLRGQPAVVLGLAAPHVDPSPPPLLREKTQAEGADSGIQHLGEVELRADGSAEIRLEQRYQGRYAIMLRNLLGDVPVARREDVVEARLLGLALPGGRVTELEVERLAELDEPVSLAMRIEVPHFAQRDATALVVDIPFVPELAVLGAVAERQSPLYLSERLATGTRVRLDLALPPGAELGLEPEPTSLEHGSARVEVSDQRLGKRRLRVERSVTLPAGRISPAEYPAFREFILAADAALRRPVRVRLGR